MEDYPVANVPTQPANWSENYALAGFDPKCGVDVFLALGRWRHDLSLWREMVTIALPDGTIAAHRAIGNGMASDRMPGGSNMQLEIVEDGRAQRWSFLGAVRRVPVEAIATDILRDGPLVRAEFCFDFHSDAPGWDLGSSGKTSAVAGHSHLEQIGRTTARISIGDDVFEFDSFINRDHSRGPRHVGPMTRHAWLHGIFDNGLQFQAYEGFEGEETAIPRFSKASVYRDGRQIPAIMRFGPALPDANPVAHVKDEIKVNLSFEDEVIDFTIVDFPTTIHVQMTTPWDNYIGARESGSEPRRRLVEQGVRYRMADGTTGYGHMERTVPGKVFADDEIDG